MCRCDTFSYDIQGDRWLEIFPGGPTPSARVGHAACCVSKDGDQLAIYGGSEGCGVLASDDLTLLDYQDRDNPWWATVPVRGATPGSRYGHSMVYVKKEIIVYGGSDMRFALSDIWILRIQFDTNALWTHCIPSTTTIPPPRLYHGAAVCPAGHTAAGMMVIFGGCLKDGNCMNDTWGFVRHKNGLREWKAAPVEGGADRRGPPTGRCRHTCVFVGPRLLVIGGCGAVPDADGASARGSDANSGSGTDRPLPIEAYNTHTIEWEVAGPCVNTSFHASWLEENNARVVVCGGFAGASYSAPVDTTCERLELYAEPKLAARSVAAREVSESL